MTDDRASTYHAAVPTSDGSQTVQDLRYGVGFHSRYGALGEAEHVYIAHGFRHVDGVDLRLLEVGLGSGLDLLLTVVEAERTGRTVRYDALEPFPLEERLLAELDHAALIGRPDLAEPLVDLVTGSPGRRVSFGSQVNATRLPTGVEELGAVGTYDLIYYDPFGPGPQPELWRSPVLGKVHAALRTGGVLVTYCAKGDVRRAFKGMGATVERLKGPRGKREMLRITRNA